MGMNLEGTGKGFKYEDNTPIPKMPNQNLFPEPSAAYDLVWSARLTIADSYIQTKNWQRGEQAKVIRSLCEGI